MKKNLIAVVTLGLMLAAPALAQTASMKVNVPFDFIVNGKTLPAGEYQVDTLSTSASTIAIMASIVPMPRGASTRPAVITGYPIRFCR